LLSAWARHNPPTHASDHGLAVPDLQAALEVFAEVGSDQVDALLRSDHGLQLRPLALEPFFAGDLLVLGDLLEARVDPRLPRGVQSQLGQPPLVVDRDRCPVLHGLLDVVDADVVPEDGAGVGVLLGREKPMNAA
jgi:hypothetical protein